MCAFSRIGRFGVGYAGDVNIRRISISAAAVMLAACQAPAPPAPPAPARPDPPAPIVAPKPDVVVPPQADAPKPAVRLAPLDPVLEEWKQRAAERIYDVSRAQLFEGRPEHLLRAVIVVELTVDRVGKVTRSRIMRSPGIASLDSVALRSLQAASPLPAPPARLTAKGPLIYQETWLFRKDGRFQLRSLALPQD